MNEQLDNLKAEYADNITYSVERQGHQVVMDENGPAGFGLISLIIKVLDAQAKEIEELKKKK